MKGKLLDLIGYVSFILMIIIISPYLFISGGLQRIIRFYQYVSANVHEKRPKKYYY